MSFDAVKTERDSPRAIAVAGWLISAIAIVGVAITFVPTPERSDYFWYRILWAEFLAGLVWGFTGGFITSSLFAKKSPRSQGGILPTLGVVVVIYAVLSLALMLKQAYTHETDFLDRFHLTLQIVLLAVTGILCVFLQLSQTAAAHGLEPLAEGMQSPPELCDCSPKPQMRTHASCLMRSKNFESQSSFLCSRWDQSESQMATADLPKKQRSCAVSWNPLARVLSSPVWRIGCESEPAFCTSRRATCLTVQPSSVRK
jgi:hypothetical protein